jgi:hypothetical protein
MARFRTVTTGGSWTGGGTQTPTCNATDQGRIRTALGTIRNVVDNRWNLNGLDGIRQSLRDMLNCSLEIDCNNPDCATLAGRTPSRGEHRIQLCGALGGTQARLTATLFHEMIHAGGGTELDAEALENHFFAGAGATMPTGGTGARDDFPLFRSDRGNWILWDEPSCQLFVKRLVGGSWIESPREERGGQLTPRFCVP